MPLNSHSFFHFVFKFCLFLIYPSAFHCISFIVVWDDLLLYSVHRAIIRWPPFIWSGTIKSRRCSILVDLQCASTIHTIMYLCNHDIVYLRNVMVLERTLVAYHLLRLQFSRLMSVLPVVVVVCPFQPSSSLMCYLSYTLLSVDSWIQGDQLWLTPQEEWYVNQSIPSPGATG